MLDRQDLKSRVKKLLEGEVRDGGARGSAALLAVTYRGEGHFDVNFVPMGASRQPNQVLLPLPPEQLFNSLSPELVDALGEKHLADSGRLSRQGLGHDPAQRTPHQNRAVAQMVAAYWKDERPLQVAEAVDRAAESAIRALERIQPNYFAFTDYGQVFTADAFNRQDDHDEAFDLGNGQVYVPSPTLKALVQDMPEDRARALLHRRADIRMSFDRLQGMGLKELHCQPTATTPSGEPATWKVQNGGQDITRDVANVLGLPFKAQLGAFFKETLAKTVEKLSLLLTGEAYEICLAPRSSPGLAKSGKSRDAGR